MGFAGAMIITGQIPIEIQHVQGAGGQGKVFEGIGPVGGIEIFPGNYDYYREKTEQQAIAAAKAPQPEKEKKQNSSGYRTKEDRAREAKARARLRELEQQIESLEDEIAAIEAELASPNAFAGDYQKMQEACITLEERKKELSDRMDEWEQLA